MIENQVIGLDPRILLICAVCVLLAIPLWVWLHLWAKRLDRTRREMLRVVDRYERSTEAPDYYLDPNAQPRATKGKPL